MLLRIARNSRSSVSTFRAASSPTELTTRRLVARASTHSVRDGAFALAAFGFGQPAPASRNATAEPTVRATLGIAENRMERFIRHTFSQGEPPVLVHHRRV